MCFSIFVKEKKRPQHINLRLQSTTYHHEHSGESVNSLRGKPLDSSQFHLETAYMEKKKKHTIKIFAVAGLTTITHCN